jgi:hypothetical protein
MRLVNAQKFGRTKRFDVFRVRVKRDPKLGRPRDVYMAWHHSEDLPRPVCTVTLWDWTRQSEDKKPHVFVEWINVDDEERRKGIATEVMSLLISKIKGLTYSGATEQGEKLCDKLDRIKASSKKQRKRGK